VPTPLTSAAGAIAQSSAALLDAAAVTLTAPLYTGIGGILDGDFWLDATPGVGTTVYYDSTYITIYADGEISSTTNNCTAAVQFQDASGTFHYGTVTLYPNPVGYSAAQAAASATLSLVMPYAAFAGALASASGALPILFSANAGAIASAAVPSISATTPFASDAGAIASVQAVFQGGAVFHANATAFAAASTSLTVAAALRANASAIAASTSALTAGAAFAAGAFSVTVAGATVKTSIALAAAAGANPNSTAAVTTSIMLSAAAGAINVATPVLKTTVPLAASAGAISYVAAPFTANAIFANEQAAAVASASAGITINIALRATALGLAEATAVAGYTPFAAFAQAIGYSDPEFQYTGSPVGLWPVDPCYVLGCGCGEGGEDDETPQFQPLAPASERVLTFDFIDMLDPGETLTGVVEVNVSVNTDFTGEATAEILSGVASYDEAMQKVCIPVQNGQQDVWYYFEVTASTSNPEKTLTRYALLPVRS